ncbi:hypothetical protein AB2762_07195 [Acinetobacter indicus]
MIWLWSGLFPCHPASTAVGGVKEALRWKLKGIFPAVSGRGKTLRQSGPAGDSSGCTGGAGRFNDQAYVSNIDLLLAKDVFSSSETGQNELIMNRPSAAISFSGRPLARLRHDR